MKTILDEFYTTFLHALVYTDGMLRVVVAEGFRAKEPEDITILGVLLKGTYAVRPLENSRLVEVRFSKPIAWQMVDESFTVADKDEERDDNSKLQVLGRSKYLAFVRANHGWFEDIHGPGKHYCVLTENEIVDVVACEPPTIRMHHRGTEASEKRL